MDVIGEWKVGSLRTSECAVITLASLGGVLLIFGLTLLSIGLVTSCKTVVAYLVHVVWLVGEIAVALLAAITSGTTITMSILASAAVACYTLPPSALPVRVVVSSAVSTASMLAAGSTLLYFASFPFNLEVCVSLVTAAAASVGCASAWAVGVMSLVERDTHQSGLKMTTILDAVRRNNHRMLRILVTLHAGLTQREIDLALVHAVRVGLPECTEVLLGTGANPNTLDSHENTPLVLACETGNRRIAAMLLDHGADVNLKSGPNGTALHHAAKWGYEDVVQLLLTRGAEVNLQDGLWRTPLMLAAGHAHNANKIMGMLIDAGCDVRVQGTYGRTALHCAAAVGLDVRALLVAGADPAVADSEGNTCLHVAAKGGWLSVLQELLTAGCDVTCQNVHQQTPLHLAASSGQTLECLQCLVDAGANPCLPDNSHHAPVWLAASCGHLRRVQYFIRLSVPLDSYHDERGVLRRLANPLHVALQREHLAIAKILLIAGCSAAPLHEWLYDIPADCANMYCNVPYINWLRGFVSNAPRLLHQCRLGIRRTLGRRLPEVVDQLPLPKPIRCYVVMEDVDDSLDADLGVFGTSFNSEPPSPM